MSRSGVGRLAWWLPIVLLLVVTPVLPGRAGTASSGSSGAMSRPAVLSVKTTGSAAVQPQPPSVPKKTHGKRSVELPARRMDADTILAEVQPGRRITVGEFRRDWAQLEPPSRPDSLTPKAARQFLDLLIDKEVLAVHATRQSWTWTSLESAQVANLKDRTVMRVALDSVLLEMAAARSARRDSVLNAEALGIAARESTVARLGATYDEALLGNLARVWANLPKPSADSSIMSRLRILGQMPAVDRADEARVIAWSQVGTYKVSEILDGWKKLNPLFRPRIENAEQMRDLVKNGLFERVLRRQATIRHLDRHPLVVDAVRRQSEFLDVQYYVTHAVYDSLPMDSLTLRRYFDKDPTLWAIPERVRVLRLVLSDRVEALRMGERLRDKATAETLLTKGAQRRVNYGMEVTAQSDSALFARAKKSGPNTVLGPDAVQDGWAIMRVNEIVPMEMRSFDEAMEFVRRAWAEEESERRMQALLKSLRGTTPVVVNESALDRLVREGIPRTRRGAAKAGGTDS